MLACPSVLSAVNKNRQKFEPYADISEEAFSNFNHNHNQIKTLMAKYKMMKLKIQVLLIIIKMLPMQIQMNIHHYPSMH